MFSCRFSLNEQNDLLLTVAFHEAFVVSASVLCFKYLLIYLFYSQVSGPCYFYIKVDFGVKIFIYLFIYLFIYFLFFFFFFFFAFLH